MRRPVCAGALEVRMSVGTRTSPGDAATRLCLGVGGQVVPEEEALMSLFGASWLVLIVMGAGVL